MVDKKISMGRHTLIIQNFGLSIFCTLFLYTCPIASLWAQADSIDYRLGTSEWDVDIDSSFFYYSNVIIDENVDSAKELYHKYDSIGLSQMNVKHFFYKFSIPYKICFLDAVNKYYGDRILGDYLSIFPEQKRNFYFLLSDRIICPSMWARHKYFQSFLENNLVENDPYYFELITIYDLESLVDKMTLDTLARDIDNLQSKIVLGEALKEREIKSLKELILQAHFGDEEMQDSVISFIRTLYDRVKLRDNEHVNEWFFQDVLRNVLQILNSRELFLKLSFLAKDNFFQERYFDVIELKIQQWRKGMDEEFWAKLLYSDKQDKILPDSTVQELLEMMKNRDDIWYPFVKLN